MSLADHYPSDSSEDNWNRGEANSGGMGGLWEVVFMVTWARRQVEGQKGHQGFG